MNAPLVKSIRVEAPIDHAFAVFTAKIDLWWPKGHRRYPESEMVLEERPGGRFVERSPSGEEALFGEILVYEPPSRLSYSWYPGSNVGPTEVDVRFTDMGDHTLVEVTHSEGRSGLGELWTERVGRFEKAWIQVLPAFAEFANGNSSSENTPAETD